MLRTTNHRSRGITLIGLLFWAIVVAFVALIVVRVLPTVNEYSTILRAVQQIARTSPTTVAEVRAAFEKQKEVEYSIASISGKDLMVTKENDKLVIRFAYDKEVPLFEPVFLLIKYSGEGRAN
jgi:type II secretory pathway pseudopilin PulG